MKPAIPDRPVNESYEERYLAFIDILGFANIVHRSQSSTAAVTQLFEALSEISDKAKAVRSGQLKLEVTSFSDTVVISTPVGDADLLHLLQVIDGFCYGLLMRNMLFRGAMVRGNILHKPDLIFGPALVDAYKLETSISFHPRVMLRTDVYNAADTSAGTIKEKILHYIVTDAYDVPYLNPFARWQAKRNLGREELAELVQLQGIIAAGLVAGANNPSVGEKYKWLARKFNKFISSHIAANQLAMIELE